MRAILQGVWLIFLVLSSNPSFASYCPDLGLPICHEVFFQTSPGEASVSPIIVIHRVIYHRSDRVAQAVVAFPHQQMTRLQIRLVLTNAGVIYKKYLNPCDLANQRSANITVGGPPSGGVQVPTDYCISLNHIDVRIDLTRLTVGLSTLEAAVVDTSQNLFPGIPQARAQFTIDAIAGPASAFPSSGVGVTLLPQTAVTNAAWGISTGIPIPKGALNDTDGLVLLESRGQGTAARAVPAQFVTRAR